VTRHPYLLGMTFAVAILVCGLLAAVYLPSAFTLASGESRWVSFGFYTAALFGLTIYFWREDANATFWALVGAFLLLHIAGFAWVISVRGGVGPFGYPVIGPVEYVIVSLGIFYGMEFGKRHRQRHSKGQR
jgi:hypothetical protein